MDQDKIWESIEFILFNEERKKNGENEVQDIIDLLKIDKNEKLLDLCCGVGRHTLKLARLGYNVAGVDITQGFLEKIKNVAISENLNIELTNCNMTDYKKENEFDVILNLWDSFGMNSMEDDFNCLKNIYDSLKEGGRFVMEISTTEAIAKNFIPKKWYFDNGMYIMRELIPDEDLRGLTFHWIVIKGFEKFEFKKYFYQYTSYELVNIIKKIGFNKHNLFENFKGHKYSYGSNNLVLVAYK